MNTMIYQIKKRSKIDPKYDPANLEHDECDYSELCKEK